MKINFLKKNVKNSQRQILFINQIEMFKNCYELTVDNQLKKIIGETLILEKDLMVKIDHLGKIFEFGYVDESGNYLLYPSQLGQDKFIDMFLEKKENGFFIDVGANNGVDGSNTLFFEKERNWNGICIEPLSEPFKNLMVNRKSINLNICISNFDGLVEFTNVDGYANMLSGISDQQNDAHKGRINYEIERNGGSVYTIKSQSKKLQSIIDEYGIYDIDYCSIDVEGGEFEVIKSIDFDKSRINIFSIENNYSETQINNFLEEKGYLLYKKLNWDDIFIRKELLEKEESKQEYMNINLQGHKIKDSGEQVFFLGDVKLNSKCYQIKNDTEILLVSRRAFLLENNLSIKTDDEGTVYECIHISENNDSIVKKIYDEITPLLKEIERKILSHSKKESENPTNHSSVSDNTIHIESSPTILSENETKKLNILVTAICFINRNKQGAEIYATFANRLINDVMNKTPYDFRIITNEPQHFEENKNSWGGRVIVTEDNLVGDKITVGPFNQLLKYKVMFGVENKYDWILYLDCDAGFISDLNVEELETQTKQWEDMGYDFLAARTNAVLKNELLDHENKKNSFLTSNPGEQYNPWVHGGNLFSAKFIFYDVSSDNGPLEWMDAKLPSEHVWYIKNNEKLEVLGKHFKNFNEKFQSQDTNSLITWDMEAFEVGVSAKLAGYNMGDLGSHGEFQVLKIGFNFNNWEKVKL